MKLMLWLLALSSYKITVHCSLTTIVANSGGIGGIYKGPDSKTIIQGPDGSIITSQQQGGTIQTKLNLEPIIVAEPETLEVGTPSLEPVPVQIVEQDPHIIETEIIDVPVIESKESSNLVGPSGSITTRGSESVVSGPASTTITKAAKILIAAPLISAVPIIASVSTPFVQINNELPDSLTRLDSGSTISSLLQTKLDGINLGSTISPPLSILPTNAARVIPLDGVGIGSTIAPPLSLHPSPDPRDNPVEPHQRPILLTGEQLDDVRPNSVPIAISGLLSGEQLASIRPELVSFNAGQHHIVSTTQQPKGVNILQPYGIESSTAATPVSSRGNVQNIPQEWLLNRQLGSVRPELVSLNVGQHPIVSTTQQPKGVNILQSYGIESSTAATPVSSRGNIQNIPQEWLLNRQLGSVRPELVSLNAGQHSIVSTTQQLNGVNVLDEGTSGYLQPYGIESSTATTTVPNRGNVQNIPQEWLLNRQLVVDPSQIPQHNIVPPEIGFGSTIEASVPKAPGLLSTSPNIQRGNLQNGYYQNEIIVGNGNGQLLSSTNPQNEIGIAPSGVLGSELNRAGVDSSKIRLVNVPISDVIGLSESGSQDYDDRVGASLWNRYGRKIRNRED